MKMTCPAESDPRPAPPVVEARLAKAPTKHAGKLQALTQDLWLTGEFTSGPFESVAAVAMGHEFLNLSWAPVQQANILALSDAYLAKSGQMVRERLQEQLGVVFGHSRELDAIRGELAALRQLLETLTGKVDRLAANPVHTICVRSFAPEPFEVAVPLDILIAPDEEDGFQAAFLDAKLHAYGETKEDALSNIKATILDTYRRLCEMPDTRLGRSMLRQKQVLNHYLREAQTR